MVSPRSLTVLFPIVCTIIITSGCTPRTSEALASLRISLEHPDPRIREGACNELTKLSVDYMPEIISLLRKALRDPDSWVRVAAVDSLLTIDRSDEKARRELVLLIKNEQSGIRVWSCLRTRDFPDLEGATSILRLLLRDSEEDVRSAASSALCYQNAVTTEILYELTSALEKDSSNRVKIQLIQSLGMIGKNSPIVEHALEKQLLCNSETSVYAAQALGKIGIETRVAPSLLKAMHSDNAELREFARQALEMIKKDNSRLSK